MTDYAITGKKGTGKSLYAVGVIRDALLAGKRVATNLDIHLAPMFGPFSKATLFRLPDKPVLRDFEMLGRGQPGVLDDENGIIVLDEASTIFAARQFGDRDRQPVLDWLVHSRKLGWDVYYICQGLIQIDKVIRDTQVEYHIAVKNTKKWPIPFITPIGRIFGINIRFPEMHLGITRQGVAHDGMVLERRFYRSKELFSCYDTQQLFYDRDSKFSVGLHTVLPPVLTQGRYIKNPPCKAMRFIYAVVGYNWVAKYLEQHKEIQERRKPKSSLMLDLMIIPVDKRWSIWRWIAEHEGYWLCVD